MSHTHFSTFLFARSSFAEGCARIVDFGGTLQEYNSSLTAMAADYYAIAADWRAIASDLQGAIDSITPGTNRVQAIQAKAKR